MKPIPRQIGDIKSSRSTIQQRSKFDWLESWSGITDKTNSICCNKNEQLSLTGDLVLQYSPVSYYRKISDIYWYHIIIFGIHSSQILPVRISDCLFVFRIYAHQRDKAFITRSSSSVDKLMGSGMMDISSLRSSTVLEIHLSRIPISQNSSLNRIHQSYSSRSAFKYLLTLYTVYTGYNSISMSQFVLKQ